MHDDAPESAKQRLYRLAFDDDPRPVIVLGLDGRVLIVNRAAGDLLGRIGDELLDHFAVEGDRVTRFTQFCEELRLRGSARADLPLESGVVGLEGKTHGDQLVVRIRVRGQDDAPRGAASRRSRAVADTVRPGKWSSKGATRPKGELLRTG